MNKKRKPLRWTPIDQPALEQLSRATATPGVVHSLATSDLPKPLQQLPGAVSYFLSGYTVSPPPVGAVSLGGEIVVVRTDGQLNKGYNYVFGTSSNGSVFLAGPFKDFPQHHVPSTDSVPIASLFGHWTNKVR